MIHSQGIKGCTSGATAAPNLSIRSYTPTPEVYARGYDIIKKSFSVFIERKATTQFMRNSEQTLTSLVAFVIANYNCNSTPTP